jgi:internalin A
MNEKELIDIIQRAANEGWEKLELQNQRITSIPEAIGKLTELKELHLLGNALVEIPSAIEKLEKLRVLSLARNSLKELPSQIGKLHELRELYLDRNCLISLPDEIGQLFNLDLLFLIENQLSTLPESFTKMRSLRWVTLARNKLKALPQIGDGELPKLRTLYLDTNALISLPETIGQLVNLEELFLDRNQLDSLPERFADMRSLRWVTLDDNQFKEFPLQLCRLPRLEQLSLSGNNLTALPPNVGAMRSLRKLHVARNPIKFSGDPSPLASLASLQSLDLSDCFGLRAFAPLESLLPTLKELYLFGCKLDDLPPEVCGESEFENVLGKVHAHYEDLKSGPKRHDAEVKVLFLGNGGVGKTQLCRRLRGEEFDPSVPSTHGILLSAMALALEGFENPVRLNLWDFGGQEVYHGSHALFVQGQAVFLILWTQERERQTVYQEGGLSFRHRPLAYWLDYLRAFAGVNSSVVLIQSQCDTSAQRALLPPVAVDDFKALQRVQVSAKTGLGLGLLAEALRETVGDCLYWRPPPPIGAGRVRVRDRLRQLLVEDQVLPAAQRRHQMLERIEFDQLCDEMGGISDKEALLDFLHHSGVVFCRLGLFSGRIVLDQNWALEAIYALFDRKKALPLLRGYGRFSRKDLEALIWSGYTAEEQMVFLGMMESCGICFRVREISNDEWEYIAPELLPEWSDAQELLLGRLRDDPPDTEATARYAFLHEGVLRGYLSKLGEHAKDAAIYWKYGCWFYEKMTSSQVLIESNWDDDASEFGAGTIRFRAWGERASDLIEQQLLQALQSMPVGQPPEIRLALRPKAFSSSSASVVHRLVRDPPSGQPPDIVSSGDAVSLSHGAAETGDKAEKPSLNQLRITARADLPPKSTPEIFVSYAWGDDSSEQARQRTEVVDRLCQRLVREGWNVLRDSGVMRPGELISGFMKRIGLADHVIVVLSDKYLHSTYCMTELHSIYQQSLGKKEDFLRRIIPLVLADARFDYWRDRVGYAEYWETEFKEMEQHCRHLGVMDFALYKAMQNWHNHVGDILAHVNDVLHPHGFEAIVKDDFAGLHQMLQRRR